MRRIAKRTISILAAAGLRFSAGCTVDGVRQCPTSCAPATGHNNVSIQSKPFSLVEGPTKVAGKRSAEGQAAPSRPDVGIVQTGVQIAVTNETADNFFNGVKTLTPARAVSAVLERSPTLEQMQATAAAVQARYPQAVSLDDPMLNFNTAPGSIGAQNASYAAQTVLSQKVPYFGKRGLRGQVVQAEANAALQDVDDARLQLTESTLNSYADYFLTEQALVVNADNLKILQDFRRNAETRYKNGQAPQQDLLQADVEIARQQERTVFLERSRLVAKARLNTLMHLAPDSPLPPPDTTAPLTQTPDATALRARAMELRPDLKALAARVAAEQASVELALREYKPDVELAASYDSFWQGVNGHPLQWQVGAKINLPVRLSRRSAAVVEAQSKVAQRRAELSRMTDQVNLQVQEAFEMLRESDRVIQIYDKKILPAAEANIKEAQASYVNAKVPFITLLEAQRSFIGLKDRYFEALAEAVRRRAALERAVGEAIDVREPVRN